MIGSTPPSEAPRPLAIPLRDLSRAPDDPPGKIRHGRSSSYRARDLLPRASRLSASLDTRYHRVGDDPDADPSALDDHVTTPEDAYKSYRQNERGGDDAPHPRSDQPAFGLSFEDPPNPPNPPTARPGLNRNHTDGQHASYTLYRNPSFGLGISMDDQEGSPEQPVIESDRIGLTDTRFLAPISGANIQSSPRRSASQTRLGDDLAHTQAGLVMGRPSSASSSKSMASNTAASSLSRAGTIMRKMSQRVVNLSNEADPLEVTMQEDRVEREQKEARMQEPPTLPALQSFAHDQSSENLYRVKSSLDLSSQGVSTLSIAEQNPLKGRTLGVFGPDNKFRQWLCDILIHPITEPIILILIIVQTIILAVDSASNFPYGAKNSVWTFSWAPLALLVLFGLYTFELMAKIVVSGFVKNAHEYSTINDRAGFNAGLHRRVGHLFRLRSHDSTMGGVSYSEPPPSFIRSLKYQQVPAGRPDHSRQQQRYRLARRAFLRHSFNRLDLLAVVSFWISLLLAITSIEPNQHVYIFQMLSSLRILRLLSLTTGTSVILRSLKKAAPMLLNVAFLIGFFWLLFAVVGIQAFKSSFRRTCVWYGQVDLALKNASQGLPYTGQNWTQNIAPENFQLCGGHLDYQSARPMPWVRSDLVTNGTSKHKGYLCPVNSLCVEGENPYNGTVSFDNMLQSLQLVFVIMSANTFSDLLYYTTNSDLLAAALFFAFGIVILSLWLTNLLVAVITSSFQVIREESQKSAFTAEDEPHHVISTSDSEPKRNALRRLYDKIYWLWIIIILFGFFVMCLRSANMGDSRIRFISTIEIIETVLLAFEIVFRFAADWRHFHQKRQNWVDLLLAIITSLIIITPVGGSNRPYDWLTVFQILRIYRVVLAVPFIRDLLLRVLGNTVGLLNLIVFVFLLTFLTAIFAVQIFRGDFPIADASGATNHITFSNIYNSFIGMYQIFSSENWTILMYNATQFDVRWRTAWIGATFCILWFILANFIVLNMFIAVIQENFDVSEDEKRVQQVRAFLQQKELGLSMHSNLSLSTILGFGNRAGRRRDPLDYGPATLEMLLQDTVFRDFLNEHMDMTAEEPQNLNNIVASDASASKAGGLPNLLDRARKLFSGRELNPFNNHAPTAFKGGVIDIQSQAREVVTAADTRRRAQRQYLQNHPRYNVSLFIFGPRNPLRRFCQSIVGPSRGTQRIEGVEPIKSVWYTFSAIIYAAIVGMVLLACISTPLYQKQYFQQNGVKLDWVLVTDIAFTVIFTLEAIIKVVADGAFWAPNAYFRGLWGYIDGLVLVTLWISVLTAIFNDGAVFRAVGALKALRALRLVHISDSARDTCHSVLILGGWKVISAAFVSLSLLLPFAVYGVNLFNGQMRQCNDSSINSLRDCGGEWFNTPYGWNVLTPRVAANPYYNFDNFGNSLSILFQIVSQEGWTDVMWSAMSITGREQNPQPYASQGNAVFFIIFNLLGAVFVLTLFVSVFMRNYTEETGVAFLTADQRSWLELRKLLRQISPSKRPSEKAETGWRAWCYRIVVKKHGKWQRFVTVILLFHVVLLVLEFYPEPVLWQRIRDYIFLLLTICYIANVVIRISGLTWKRFRRSSWDLYSVFAITGTIITTLLDLSQYNNTTYAQLHKFFLVSIALLLIPRNNQLDQLFKTAAASLTTIGNLLATWFILFLVYAIALTQAFGLTRFGANETGNLNFRNVPKALILLFRMSCGEGWNAIMEDYATITPPNCNASSNFWNSDCGSAAWARTLFISWNILSMYIFVSLFVSLIFESFSYVYQQSSDLAVVTREELRRFKQAWATFDPEGTGYIAKDVFPRLLGELSGVFEMRIYSGGDHSVHRILENCKVDTRGRATPPSGTVHGVNLAELNRQLRMIDVDEIRRRRNRMEVFFQEIMVSAHPSRGVNFTSCLMILAHYNVITDSKSLKLEEYLRRRARLQRVEEEVRRRIVRGFFDMMFWLRRFRARHRVHESARMVQVPQFSIPEILIDDEDSRLPDQDNSGQAMGHVTAAAASSSSNTQPLSLDTSTIRRRSLSLSSASSRRHGSEDHSPLSRSRDGSLSPDYRHSRPSFSQSPRPSGESKFSWSPSMGGHPEFHAETFDAGSLSPGTGLGRAASLVDRRQVLDVFDNSAWGQSMRRSFTIKRSQTTTPHRQNSHDNGGDSIV